MKARLREKNQAIELRKQGLSYSEIGKIVPVSKGILSRWLTKIELSPEEERDLHLNQLRRKNSGKINSVLVNRRAKLNREIVAFEDAKKIFSERQHDRSFLVGIALYWAEGAKKHGAFQFTNSDPDMVVFMHRWIQKYLNIDKEQIKCRIFVRRTGYEHVDLFWAGKLGVDTSIFEKTTYGSVNHIDRKNPDSKGCLRLCITRSYVLRLMRAWQKLLIQYHSDMRP